MLPSTIPLAANGRFLVSCSPASLVLMSADGYRRMLSPPPPPSGYSAKDQAVFNLRLSRDGSVVAARYDLGVGSYMRNVLVWTGSASAPSLFASHLRGTPGELDLRSLDLELMSADGSTVVGFSNAGPSWLLRID
jgi:hypothetical protein